MCQHQKVMVDPPLKHFKANCAKSNAQLILIHILAANGGQLPGSANVLICHQIVFGMWRLLQTHALKKMKEIRLHQREDHHSQGAPEKVHPTALHNHGVPCAQPPDRSRLSTAGQCGQEAFLWLTDDT